MKRTSLLLGLVVVFLLWVAGALVFAGLLLLWTHLPGLLAFAATVAAAILLTVVGRVVIAAFR